MNDFIFDLTTYHSQSSYQLYKKSKTKATVCRQNKMILQSREKNGYILEQQNWNRVNVANVLDKKLF